MLFLLVSLSVLGLGVGAALVPLGRVRAEAASALDGLALGMLPALVLARLLPHAFESLGGWTLAFAGAGFALASLPHTGEHAELRMGSALVLPALWLHAVTDGAALAMSSSGRVGESGLLLATAAILHRVPEGLFVASHRKRRQLSGALLAVAPLALATVLGALLGQRIFDVLPDAALDAVLALGAGAMLRLVGHSHGHGEPTTATRPARALAALSCACGLVVVLAMPDPHDVLTRAQPRELAIAASVLPLFIESAPALLLGWLGMSALRALVHAPSPQLAASSRGVWNDAARGLVQGFLRPGSDDASTASFLASAASGALLAAGAAAVSLPLLGNALTLARVAISVVLVLSSAVLGARLATRGAIIPQLTAANAAAPASRRFATALLEQLNADAAWLALGLLLAAALEAGVAPGWLAQIPAPWDVWLGAVLAIPGYVSALGATPTAAVLLHKGASIGAVLAWLCAAPLFHLARLGRLARTLGVRAAWGMTLGTVLLASAAGLSANVVLSRQGVPDVHPLLAHRHNPFELLCAAAAAGLWLATLLRVGPRALASTLSAEAHAHDTGEPTIHAHAPRQTTLVADAPDPEAHLHHHS